MVTPRFTNIFRKMAPRWLTEGDGELVLTTLGLLEDALVERTRQGIKARFPQEAPSDALAPLGRDRRIIRGISESDEDYAARLLRWLDDWKVAGNPYALMGQIRAYCGVDMRTRTVDTRGNWYTIEADGTRSYSLAQANWDWDGDADKWSRFWVILYPPAELWTISGQWGNGALWSSGKWGNPGATFGTTATPEQIRSIRSIIADWKPAGTRCPYVIVAFDDASFDPVTSPGAPMPDGTWGRYSTGTNPAVKSRLDTARYWKGTS